MIKICEIKAGCESAFTKVFNAYHSKLYFYFLKKIKTDAAAQELTQLVFIKLWRFRHTLSETIQFDKQMFTIAVSVLIDFVRRQKTYKQKFIVTNQAMNFESKTDANEDVYENEDYFLYLTSTLPPVRKNVFILNRVYGFSYKEIAEQLSISVKTVEDHIRKATKQLGTITVPVIILFCFCYIN